MSIKHTPGPWVICYGTAAEYYIRPEKTPEGHNPIAGMDYKTPYSGAAYAPIAKVLIEDDGQVGYNARLIAAAPDMLELLKRVLDYDGFEGNKIGDQIRAAIAKAEGRL